jgi:hypothetical protein
MLQRLPSRAWLAALTTLMVGSVDATLPSDARAAGRPGVSIGDVKVAQDAGASSDAAELGRTLRSALSEELARVGPLKRPLIVNATLTQLSSERRQERTKASATISIALSRADDRVLFAELRGRASVEEASANLASLHRAALQGAVHGALARLPEAVERSR